LQRKLRDIENDARGTLKGVGIKLARLGNGSFDELVCEWIVIDHPKLLEMFEEVS